MKVSIYGIGNFGYALLRHLDKYSLSEVNLFAFDRNETLRNNLRLNRKHLLFHTNTMISEKIIIVESIKELLDGCDVLILAVNSNAIREVIKNCEIYLRTNRKIIILNTAKALDYISGKPLSLIVEKELKFLKNYSYSVISGGQ